MMAITPTFSDGRLDLVGDAANDTVVISTMNVGGIPQVTVNGLGVGSGVPAAAVTSIVADLGAGNDTVNLSTLNLNLFSDLTNGSVTLVGGVGNDNLTGTALADTLIGGDNNDILVGGAGNDTIDAGNANDTLDGGDGDDLLTGGNGIDTFRYTGSGQLGSDTLVESPTDNFDDTLHFAAIGGPVTFDLALTTPQVVRPGLLTITLSSGTAFERIEGTGYADVFYGNARNNYINGANGNDLIWVRDGADNLLGGAGDDIINGEGGNDTLNGNQGNDSLYGGDGDDNLTGHIGNDYLSGGMSADTYTFTTASAGGLDTIDELPSAGADRFNVAGLPLTTLPDFDSTAVQALTSLQSIQFVTAGAVEWFLGGSVNAQTDTSSYDGRYYTVPGPADTPTLVEFTYGGADAGYNNTIYVYDATDPANRDAARPVSEFLFKGNVTPLGTNRPLLFKAGTRLGFFIEQNASPNDLFFADDTRNDNDIAINDRNHENAFSPRPGEVQLRWEDLYYERPNPRGYKFDDDYNDLFISVAAVKQNVPVVSIQAIDDVAHEAYRDTGTYVITRESGSIDEQLSIEVIVSGDATYQWHYELSPDLAPLPLAGDDHRSIITLPSGVEKVYVNLTPLVEDTDNRLRKATIEIPAPQIPLYAVKEGYEEATVTIKPADQQGDLIITGIITYEGPTGGGAGEPLTLGTLPVRAAKVEIWDENGSLFEDERVGTTYTDDNGRYEIRISSQDTVTWGNNVDPFIRVVAKSAPQDVVTIAHEVAVPGLSPANKRFVEDADVTSHGPGSLTLDGAIKDATDENINGAFSIFDAIYSASRYHVTLPGVQPGTVKAQLTDAAGSSYTHTDGTIRMAKTARFSWDTISHEYGHFAHHHAGVAFDGGSHSFGINTRFSSPANARQLAFTEGFATYFSIVSQLNTPKPPSGVAGFGDTAYWKLTNLAIWERTDVEADGPMIETRPVGDVAIVVGLGEDNEVSVARTLWDLQDPANDDPIDNIGPVGIWNLVVEGTASQSPTFFSLYSDLVDGADKERVWDIGRILADHNIVPSPLRTDFVDAPTPLLALDHPPTFVFSMVYGSDDALTQDKWLFTRVDIRFYDVVGNRLELDGSTVVSRPTELTTELAWTPTADQWNDLMLGLVGHWSVFVTTVSPNGEGTSEYESFASTLSIT